MLGLGIFRFVPESLYYVPNPHVSMEGPLNLDPDPPTGLPSQSVGVWGVRKYSQTRTQTACTQTHTIDLTHTHMRMDMQWAPLL